MKKQFTLLIMLFALLFSSGLYAQSGSGATISVEESRCVATGIITATGATGTGPFLYDFTVYPGDYAYTGASSNNVITALNPGNYTLRIIDQNDGSFTDYPVVVPGTYIEPDYSITPTGVSGCYNGSNGSISGTLLDGRAPFSYEIMSGPSHVGDVNSSGTFTGLTPGTYVLRGYDSCGNFQTRTTTVDNFYWGISSNASTKTGCGQYTLDNVVLNNVVPGATYSVKNGSTVLAGPSSSFPLAFNNDDATIGNVTVCAYDACGTEVCVPLTAPADWYISSAETTYPACNTFSTNFINIVGSPIGPITYGFVRGTGDTVWSSTVPFTFGPQLVSEYFFGKEIVKDGCGVIKTDPDPYNRFMQIPYGGINALNWDNCTTATAVADLWWNAISPYSFSINGGPSQSSGSFSGLTEGAYTITATDNCGASHSFGFNLDHTWVLGGYSEPYCDLGMFRNPISVNYHMTAPIVYEQWDATYSTMLSTQTYTDPTGINSVYYGPSDWYSSVVFSNAQPNTSYNYIATDACGRKDTVTVINGANGHVPNTLSIAVTPYCTGKGDMVATFYSDIPYWNSIVFNVRRADGTLLFWGDNTATNTGTYTKTNMDPGTYTLEMWNQYCSDTTKQTFVIPDYKLPKLRKSVAYNCAGGSVNVVGAGKFGLKPYTFEILATYPTNNPQPPQSSNLFTLSGTYTLVTMRLVDACGNTSLQNIAVRQPAPIPIKTVVKLPACNMTSITMYVDSSLTGATYEWKNPAGTVMGTAPEITVPTLTTADTGLYTCRIIISGTCYDVITQFRLRSKDFGCYAQLGNYVWNDTDKDGVQDGGEVGVAGVTVTLYDGSDNIVSSTVTDAYGYYKFVQLNPGDYHVGFSLPANYVFSPADQGGNDLTDSDPNTMTGLTANVTLVAGDSNMSLDAGIYQPTPNTASLGNYVWNDLDKDGVQDPNELGISGITVTLCDNAGNPVATTVTDANGFYYFKDLAPATYSVGFSKPIGYVFSPAIQGGNSATDSDADPVTGKSNPVTLAAGENNFTIDAGLYAQDPAKASLGNYVWYDADQDGRQDATEAGVAGVLVTLYGADGTTVLGTTSTDEFGYYIFNDLNPGDYVVGFGNYPAGYSLTAQNVGNDATDSDPDAGTNKTAVINLSVGERDLTIDAGIFNASAPIGALGNKVWYDRDNDGIQDATENGVPGVTVTLCAADGITVLATTSTNASGEYLFPNLAAGTYFVGFSNLPLNYGFTNSLVGGNTATDSDPNKGTGKTGAITLGAGEVNLTIDAGIVETNGRNGTASLGDIVWLDANQNGIQDAGELGVPGVTVTLYDGVTNAVISTLETDGQGNYMFTGLDAGSYKVGFSNIPAGHTFTNANQGTDDAADADADATTSGMTPVYLLAEGEENLTIDAGIFPAPGLASLGNYVWNDLNLDGIQDANEPGVPGVTVTLYTSAGVFAGVTSTDANGLYQFTGLTPGDYYVEFSNLPAGYEFTDADASGNTQDTEDSDADVNTGATPWVHLNAGDNYLDLDAGIFTEKAGLGNYVWSDLNNDGIQDANEPGIAGITVTLYDATGNTPLASTVTDADGKYQFVNLDPGTYVVGFSGVPVGASFSPQNQPGGDVNSDADPITGKTAPVTLGPGDFNPDIDAGISTPLGAGLGNYVWFDANKDGLQGANERGVAGVTVTLLNGAGTPIQSAITDQNGYYSFPNLVPGTYSVSFSTLPVNRAFTTANAGGDDAADSDVDNIVTLPNGFPSSGAIAPVTLVAGEYNPTLDGGLVVMYPVAVTKLEAAATLNGTVSTVSWITSDEKDVKNFDIQRSLDGTNFTDIASKEAKGNTIGKSQYEIKDNIADFTNYSVVYYRVISNDQDGQQSMSNTVTVRITNGNDPIQVYPSPFVNQFSLEYPATKAGDIEIIMTDAAGNTIVTKTAHVIVGSNTIEMNNFENLAKGTYFIKVKDSNSGEQFIKKLLKK